MGKTPEILAPGGDPESVKAAILAGADAVYVGFSKFNARVRARNVTSEDLKTLARLAAEYGSSLFLALNVLLTDEEIPEALTMAAEAEAMGIRDIIVQDIGLCMLLRTFFPALSVHASTQMTIHNSGQARFVKALGADRVNLARELSIQELTAVIPVLHGISLKAEIFVHGAFCVSFSGQCYMSSFIGGNSGNRGACMQPCRKQYCAEGTQRDSADSGTYSYLLSLKDNNALGYIRELLDAGADSFKIEGRIKNYQYVYTAVKVWRDAVDRAAGYDAAAPVREEAQAAPSGALNSIFNRGFTSGYLEGSITPDMFVSSPLDQSLHLIGTVKSYDARTNRLMIDGGITPGAEEIQIFSPQNAFICTAEIERSLSPNNCIIRITGKLYGKILPGYLAAVPKKNIFADTLKESLDALKPRPLSLRIFVEGSENSPLRVRYSLCPPAAGGKETGTRPGEGAAAPAGETRVESRVPLERALKKPLTADTLTAHLTGGSGLSDMSVSIDCAGFGENLFLPLSELNRMRQEAAAALFPAPSVITSSHLPSLPVKKVRKTSLLVLLSSENQSFERVSDVSIETAVEVSSPDDIRLLQGRTVYAPSVIMENELESWRKALAGNPPRGVITSNTGLGLIAGEAGIPWTAGPGVNSANSYSLEALRRFGGCGGAFLSAELNRAQIKSVKIPSSMKGYLTVFGPILMMTSRQALAADNTTNPETQTGEYYRSIKDKAGFQFHIWRRSGWYTEMYNGSLLFIPEAVSYVKDQIDFIVLDLRDFPFFSLAPEHKKTVISYFSALVEGRKQEKTIVQSLLPAVTSGNFKRGLA